MTDSLKSLSGIDFDQMKRLSKMNMNLNRRLRELQSEYDEESQKYNALVEQVRQMNQKLVKFQELRSQNQNCIIRLDNRYRELLQSTCHDAKIPNEYLLVMTELKPITP
jgi:hypothetical protein